MIEIRYQFSEDELKSLARNLIHEILNIQDMNFSIEKEKQLMTLREISITLKLSYSGITVMKSKYQIKPVQGNLYDLHDFIKCIPENKLKMKGLL